MAEERTYISFDWALKKLLHQKANLGILEGFLSELLKEDITIKSISDPEVNKAAYEHHQLNLISERNVIDAARIEGKPSVWKKANACKPSETYYNSLQSCLLYPMKN